jgi:2-dehydro-3-deoxy-D-arabinonate dehydratase
MRRLIRWIDAEGRITLGLEFEEGGMFAPIRGTDDPLPVLRGLTFDIDPTPVVPEDPYSLELGSGLALLSPLDPPEVWCAGVTYEQSRDARMRESSVPEVYDQAYAASRPDLLLKDAGARRTVGPGDPIAIRGDSIWNVPEPELGLVLGERGKILGYTIGNDVSSREIEAVSPLYATQAKVYAGSCAIGPAVYVPAHEPDGFDLVMRISTEEGEVVYEDRTTTVFMRQSFSQLVSWLIRDNPVPAGTVLLTGTGLVPPDDFSLGPGHWVEIHVPEIGTLVNRVVLAGEQ